jgi:hypothetical protein
MSDQQEKRPEFPTNWQIATDYDPNEHLMNLKGREYLNVQNRMLWFLRDQRAFVVAGLAQVPYIIRTELVEMDREAGFAHFKTYIRDVLGNEATMYGSETMRDFGDYAEKASTKSLGRALLALGYGTAFAPEMDEGDRVVDAPVDTRRNGSAVVERRPAEPVATETPVSRPAPTHKATEVDVFDETRAGQQMQSDLAGRLRGARYNTQNKLDAFLMEHVGRTFVFGALAKGETDISIGEVGAVIKILEAQAVAHG